MTHKDRHKMKDDQLPQPNLLRVFVVCLPAVGALFFALAGASYLADLGQMHYSYHRLNHFSR